MVKESLNDSYCDVSGRAGDLSLLGEHDSLHWNNSTHNLRTGEMGGMKVFAAKGAFYAGGSGTVSLGLTVPQMYQTGRRYYKRSATAWHDLCT